MKLKDKLKAIWKLWNAEEYFLTVANQKNLYGAYENGPILYEYISNTDRDWFYQFIMDHIKNLRLTNKLKNHDNRIH